MKYGLKCNGKPKFFIQFEGNEYQTLKAKLELMNLQIATTANAWSVGLEENYYRSPNQEFHTYVRNSINTRTFPTSTTCQSFIDDINSQLLSNGYFNLAIFRLIPDNEGFIYAPLNKFLTVLELNDIGKVVASLFAILFSIIAEADIQIRQSNASNSITTEAV
jgi:arginine decarboxylase-like protein